MSKQLASSLWILPYIVWFLPIETFSLWGAAISMSYAVVALTTRAPRLSMLSAVCWQVATMALFLRATNFFMDRACNLPPVGFGLQNERSDQVTVYVATRDMPEYVKALASIEASYGKNGSGQTPSSFLDASARASRTARLTQLLVDIRASFNASKEAPRLDLVLLDVGSAVPISQGSLGSARVERINDTGESGVPIFNAWEHIARTATSRRVMFFDEDILVPQNFRWNTYSQGAWFFKKPYRDYTACWSVDRIALVKMVSRLRASPHLYTASMRWGGQEDKLAIFAMGLREAPDELAYFKLSDTHDMQRARTQLQWQDTDRIFDRYMLEWNRESEPPIGFTAAISGPLTYPCIRALLRGYGVWSLADLVLLLETHLLPPEGQAKIWLRSVSDAPVFIDGTSAAIACLFLIISSAASARFNQYLERRLLKRHALQSFKEWDPLLP